MLSEIFTSLVPYFSPFNVFRYLTFRSAYAMISALVLTLLLGPLIIKKLKIYRIGQIIRLDGPASHKVKSGTPTMGGLIILFVVSTTVVLWSDLSNLYIWLALGSLLAFGILGFVDDLLKIRAGNSRGIPGWVKFWLQVAIASIICITLYVQGSQEIAKIYLPFIKNSIVDLHIIWLPAAVLYVVYWSNAVNLTDGLDGLAIGLIIIALLAFAILTYVTGRQDWANYLNIPYIKGVGELTIFNLALIGACVGFLWFNAHPASIFMGDVGSLALGGVLGVLSLMVKKEVLLILIGGVFMMEVVSVVLQVSYFKLRKGKRLFLMAPFHHHFEQAGWKESKIVLRFWILGVCLPSLLYQP